MFKIKQLQDDHNQHIVAIERNGELRCYFRDASLHACGNVVATLNRDITRHGEDVIGDINAMPLIVRRTAKSGRTVYAVKA